MWGTNVAALLLSGWKQIPSMGGEGHGEKNRITEWELSADGEGDQGGMMTGKSILEIPEKARECYLALVPRQLRRWYQRQCTAAQLSGGSGKKAA